MRPWIKSFSLRMKVTPQYLSVQFNMLYKVGQMKAFGQYVQSGAVYYNAQGGCNF